MLYHRVIARGAGFGKRRFRGIQPFHIPGVMLAMVQRHDLGADHRFQRIVGIGQGRELVLGTFARSALRSGRPGRCRKAPVDCRARHHYAARGPQKITSRIWHRSYSCIPVRGCRFPAHQYANNGLRENIRPGTPWNEPVF